MKKYPKLTIALLLLLVLLVAEGIMRGVLSVQGYTVGSLAPNWFPHVSEDTEPFLIPSYHTDSTGTFRATNAFWDERNVPVNSLGFLGREWLPIDTAKPRLLLIGDSFVWGAGAEPLSASFAATLQSQLDYQVFNSGIPGADPAQYELIARRYIPMLKPDVAVVFVYLGNDVVTHLRTPEPNMALYYPANVGWFPGFYNGAYFNSLSESYQFYQQRFLPQGWFAQLACHTAIGTALYSMPMRMEEKQEREALLQSTITNQHLKAIQVICQEASVGLIVVPIPYSGTDLGVAYEADPEGYIAQHYGHVFTGLEQHMVVPTLYHEHFHPLPDGHFNNAGHAQMAKTLINAISRVMEK